MRSGIPLKTTFTLLTFALLILLPNVAPALKNYKTLEAHDIPMLFDLPLPKTAGDPETDPAALAELRAKRLAATAQTHLTDPKNTLDSFYASLLKGGSTRILHYGDSPTTADLITADARVLLQKEFGDGGSGFVLIARPWAWYQRRGVEMDASSHWKIDIAGAAQIKDGMHGLGGVSFVGSEGASAHWHLKSATHTEIEIAYLAQPDSGAFVVEAENQPLGEVQTEAEFKTPAYALFTIPPGSTNFTVRVSRGTVRLYGVDFRKAKHGVTYSSLGINGANVTLLSRSFNEHHWASLVIINYGTNESGFETFVDGTWSKELKEVVRRLHVALPGVAVLLMSPMDRGERKTSGEIETLPVLPRLVNIENRVATETGTAFFNTFEAMGGEGTMARWYAAEPRLVGADFIHPMPSGAKIVGELLYSALRDGYNQYKLRQLNDTAGQSTARSPVQRSDEN
ncbi:MAG: GDSL-type esterase/lipase family protein [Bryobacteraceae bacterium]